MLGPAPYTFRFTGRSGTIPFKIRNLTDRPLTVRITMTSAKLEFWNWRNQEWQDTWDTTQSDGQKGFLSKK